MNDTKSAGWMEALQVRHLQRKAAAEAEAGGGAQAFTKAEHRGEADAGGAAAACLVQKNNILTEGQQDHWPGDEQGTEWPTEHVEIRAHRCRSRFCKNCCTHLGLKLRDHLMKVVEQWPGVLLVTVTLNRDSWGDDAAGAEAAFDYITKNSIIGVFVRKLRRRELIRTHHYFAVIEPHSKSPDWLHWHLLLQADRIDFSGIWKCWQEFSADYHGEEFAPDRRPAFGRVDIAPPENPHTGERYTNVQAARYVCGYLTKYPECGWPEWLRKRSKVNVYSTSKRFWSDHGVPSPSGYRERPEVDPAHKTGARKADRSIADREAECCQTCDVFTVTTDVDDRTGEVTETRVWKAHLPVTVVEARWRLLATGQITLDPAFDGQSAKRVVFRDVAGVTWAARVSGLLHASSAGST